MADDANLATDDAAAADAVDSAGELTLEKIAVVHHRRTAQGHVSYDVFVDARVLTLAHKMSRALDMVQADLAPDAPPAAAAA